ncbi:uncharacterized protein LOC114442855 isoform X2 [Parambassis ranga]|uniref:Uncharacterized protein LOC114442855 isoform X2 n=1 Tax=Parambassis ranga TaxID=210632 RepID=A0A6P7J6S9_9TELE|nr:uncharacterized protein LOC114442855 isoform X2 [Parambassis ranga]
MSRTALIKLLFVGILTFIICLPEFFTIYRVSKVNFFCLPYPPCEQGNTVKKGENRKTDDSAVTRKDMCDFPQQNQSNMTNSAPDGDSSTMSLFMCEANTNMAELDNNTSFTDLTFSLEVSVEVQLTDAETLNLTLYGRSNHSSLHLHSPEEEEEEEEEKEKEKGEGQRKAFYCCLPRMPASEPANQSRCLLWLANLTVLTAAAKEELPWKRTQKDEWQCGMRILWLALVCSVLLMIVTIVITEICRGKYLCRKPKVCPVSYNFTGHHLNVGQKPTEVSAPNGTTLLSYRLQPWSGLPPIQEIEDDINTLLDGNIDHCYTENLHHRCPSSTREEQAW